ncbi:MAG: nucleoside monophosphate kinase [Candidatus Nanoarchaeia archaeon]|jgi:adenylate kinase|nr:nucleoside monophosphate kinase [Candidatus Nanoarchaeia archaeon]MDD3993938.1 nucleoside monophosphate kinase [Candidatus Nanoarchaeia archaeon]MDD4563856.1 nucleoside monophosphate kinase [Candidatus Nanoarchaeia archaeon]
MNIIFIGIQGSGKGTQAKEVAKQLNLVHISTGDLLREQKGKLKKEIDNIINKGKLIPDELMIKLLKEKIKKENNKEGIILDGFPRTIQQAKKLTKEIKIDRVIEIKISDKESIKRLINRRTCENCKEGYNLITQPKPKNPKFCDKCGGNLIQRKDDNLEAIKQRIKTYHNQTKPILDYYKEKIIKINGKKKIEKITKKIIKKIKK